MDSEGIRIEKDGFWLYTWDGDQRRMLRQRPHHILTHLRRHVEVAEGVTLGDLFRFVEADPELCGFVAMYSWCDRIHDFHRQAQESPPEPDPEPLDYLVVGWHAQNIRCGGVNHLDFYSEFLGVGRRNGEVIRFSVSYTPMYEMAHLPVKIDPTLTIYRHRIGREEKVLIQGQRDFSLLDFLDAIYDDISFHGGPDDTAEVLADLKETVRKFDSGEIKAVPLEELEAHKDDWKKLFEDDEEEIDWQEKLFPRHECPENN